MIGNPSEIIKLLGPLRYRTTMARIVLHMPSSLLDGGMMAADLVWMS
jgi:hypothetical protein